MTAPVLYAPSRLEARALRRGTTIPVRRTGTGRRRAERTAAAAAAYGLDASLVVGVGGGLDPDLVTGDVVVADRLLRPDGSGTVQVLPVAGILAGQLRRLGLRVRSGPVVSTDHVVTGRERQALAARGALVVDMESAWLAATGVVRVVADVADEPLLRPATLGRLRTACRTLSLLGPALHAWERAVGPRLVLLAAPESTGGRRWRAVASWADLVVVVGRRGSSDGRRLLEAAQRLGARACVVSDVEELDLCRLHGVRTVAVTAEPAAPRARVDEAVGALAALGPTAVSPHLSVLENDGVTRPKEVRTA